MKKTILYLMHVDWGWIKQRPQFIAEKLEESYDLKFFYPRNYRIKSKERKQNARIFYSIPYLRRTKYLWKIDFYRKVFAVRRMIARFKPDIVYATSPEFGEMLPKSYKGKVVYDCMDDMMAFSSKQEHKDRALSLEKEMMKRADIVLATSKRLKETLCKRYPEYGHKSRLVRNGYDGNIVSPQKTVRGEKFTLCYFGTISHWFNFDFILKSLDDIPDLQYLMIGPVESGTHIPSHERIIYKPPVNHEDLEKATEEADGFIMPFELNELILAVDPVKLYEYINFGKDILCVEYPEIERFEPFVYFYNNYEAFHDQLVRMKETAIRKYSEEERIRFLADNTWDQRVNQIISLLNEKA